MTICLDSLKKALLLGGGKDYGVIPWQAKEYSTTKQEEKNNV